MPGVRGYVSACMHTFEEFEFEVAEFVQMLQSLSKHLKNLPWCWGYCLLANPWPDSLSRAPRSSS